jgi:hypothetical protein
MIGNDVLQAAIVATLKADTALTTWLAARSSSGEIREAQYQGTTFEYPAVRVAIGEQIPEGDTCYLTGAIVTFEMWCYSEHDSSQECDQLAKLAADAVFGKRISGTGFASNSVLCDSFPHAVRTGDKLWEAFSTFRMEAYAT